MIEFTKNKYLPFLCMILHCIFFPFQKFNIFSLHLAIHFKNFGKSLGETILAVSVAFYRNAKRAKR